MWPLNWIYLRGSQRTRVLITAGEEIIVVRGWPGKGEWNLPGGGLKSGEDPRQGAAREVLEETGVSLEPSDLTDIGSELMHSDGFTFYVHFLGVKLAAKHDLKPRPIEIAEATWLSPAKTSLLSLGVDVKRALELSAGQKPEV
jgi:8-oxo-dGTP pyrophosphatase MutT (NUDIX family)